MHQRWGLSVGLCGLMAVGLCVFASSQAQAASGNGPYYATPSWDQKLPAATRFVVLADWNSEAVLDRETGLVWEQSPTTTLYTWPDARLQCSDRSIGNRKGWRLPSVHELASLIDPSVSPGPALPSGHPFTNIASLFATDRYWSATTYADETSGVWVVYFDVGRVRINGKAANASHHVWCVRGSNNADAY